MSLSTAVIRAEPDGYDMAKKELMGRQAAGNGFLRAAVAARGDNPIYGSAAKAEIAKGFRAIVGQIDPSAPFTWIPSDQLEEIGKVGTLYIADPTVATHSRIRQRSGLTSFSICGVTHTTASGGTMDEIVGLLREPVTPWDALICTSTSVVETVRRVHEAEADYLRWRFGAEARIEGPQLPLIPLGVHCDDFASDQAQRAGARQALGLADDEVVSLFVGRLVFHAKAHPHPMYRALQLAAERTGKRLVLILSGWFPNPAIQEAFLSAAAQFAPNVRLIVVDGRDPTLRTHVWAAADLFISLSDNIQETFGLTPIEAMAAGLPVVVSDYDGYKDTVRDGVDGFRVRTLAPEAGTGQVLALACEVGSLTYDRYCLAAGLATVVDIGAAADAVTALVTDEALRRRMGEAGRARARGVFDWAVIYRQYQELWGELNSRRLAAAGDEQQQMRAQTLQRAAAARMDPFEAFEHYPTELLKSSSRLVAAPGATSAALAQALDQTYFSSLTMPRGHVEKLFEVASQGETTVQAAAEALDINLLMMIRITGLLAKIGVVEAYP